VTDRVKDIIVRGGENISAREVEQALAGAAGIQEMRHLLARPADGD
jgi:acyl-CoA synthetase (AMP-forming)/AMP-acid ligase II